MGNALQMISSESLVVDFLENHSRDARSAGLDVCNERWLQEMAILART